MIKKIVIGFNEDDPVFYNSEVYNIVKKNFDDFLKANESLYKSFNISTTASPEIVQIENGYLLMDFDITYKRQKSNDKKTANRIHKR